MTQRSWQWSTGLVFAQPMQKRTNTKRHGLVSIDMYVVSAENMNARTRRTLSTKHGSTRNTKRRAIRGDKPRSAFTIPNVLDPRLVLVNVGVYQT